MAPHKEYRMNVKNKSLFILGVIALVCLGLIIFSEPIQDVLSQVKPTRPGAWQGVEFQIYQILTAYPDESDNFTFEFTMAALERTNMAQENYVDLLSTITIPAITAEVAPTGIFYDRMYFPGGIIRTSHWHNVIEGVDYSVATMIGREDASQSYLMINIDSGEQTISNLALVPGNLGELKILRREGNALVIEVLKTGEILTYDFIQRELFDPSKKILLEIIETIPPTTLSPTATPTPFPIPYP